MKRRISLSLLSLFLALTVIFSVACTGEELPISSIDIQGERVTLEIGSTYTLHTNAPDDISDDLAWSASNTSVSVDENGLVTALEIGKVIVTVKYKALSDTIMIEVVEEDPDKLDDAEKEDFYGDYDPADSHEEALERSKLGLLSGLIETPDQKPYIASYQPKVGSTFIKNTDQNYLDDNTYIVVDAYGREILRVYKGGGYITLEEVAAYMYAFGDVPANYVSSKNTKPTSSIWGEYLRLNHSKFSGSTSKYPYEPELPDISGCGGNLEYYEIDIGTTGTDCDPGYSVAIYNDGNRITRGAARIVYARFERNGDKVTDPNEKYVFYTYNHYNDFQEYLNYYGGWGEMFGNVTGGGELSSKTNCSPTPYVAVTLSSFKTKSVPIVLYYYDAYKYSLLSA